MGVEALITGTTMRRPFWLHRDAGPVASWLHHPRSGIARRNGVLICPPFGFEYAHSHRTLIHLADRLADQGFAVLRIDYPGTGSSGADETLPDAVSEWVSSIEDAVGFLRALTGGPPSVVGVRLGALLAGEALTRVDANRFVAWAPVVRGRRFARELRALDRVSAAVGATPGFIQAGGYRLSDATTDALAALDLLTQKPRVGAGALIIDRLDQPIGDDLAAGFANLGIPVTTIHQADFPDMMAEPHYTRVPQTTLTAMVDWMADDDAPAAMQALDDDTLKRVVAARSANGEHLVLVPSADQPPLFGVLTEPEEPGVPQGDIVVLANSGSVHQVGPNRMYVELTRALSLAGIRSLRFDLRNLGDSRTGSPVDENHPYPGSSQADVRSAVTWLTRGTGERCAIAGICSGAHASFHAVGELADLPISGAVAINPLTFYYKPGMSLDTPANLQNTRNAEYYGKAIRDPARWKKLMTGGSDIAYIARFMLRRMVQRSADIVRSAGRAMRVVPATALERDFAAIRRAGRSIRFVFAGTDPGLELLMRRGRLALQRLERDGLASVAVVDAADHTFSTSTHRQEAIAHVVRAVRGMTVTRRIVPQGEQLWSHIAPSWTSMLEATGEPSAFLGRTWTRHWLETFGTVLDSRGVIWSDSTGRDVACAILSTGRERLGPASVSQTWLNTSGVPSIGCEHNDLLSLPQYRAEVIDDLVKVLSEIDSDEVSLVGVRRRLFDELTSVWPAPDWDGFRSESPYVDLATIRSEDRDYLSTLSRNTRSQITRSIRALQDRFGDASVQIASSSDEALEWLEEMVVLHEERWHAVGEAGAFGPRAKAFHTSLIERVFDDPGDADMSVDVVCLRFGDEPIGYLHNLVRHGHVHFYQSGFGFRGEPRLKTGLVCHALAIQHYLDRGDLEYDFGGGESSPVQYKRSLSTDIRALDWIQLPAPKWHVRALYAARSARRRWRGTKA